MHRFDRVIDRIQHSLDPVEREHLFLGRAHFGGGPVVLSRKLFGHHGLVRGGPGRGKTAFLERLLVQLVAAEAPARLEWLDHHGARWEPSSVLVLDLKGEPALFHTARLEAEKAGIPFKFFTLTPGCASHVFNFFAQSHLGEVSRSHQAQELLQALGAEYGSEYGRGFFSSINEVVLLNTLRAAHRVDSFRDLHWFLSQPDFYERIPGAVPEDLRDARHLTSLANRLATAHAMNVTAADAGSGSAVLAQQIDMRQLLRERQVVYFFLRPLQAETEAQAVARLAVFALMTAASVRGPLDTNRVVTIVDEAQVFAVRNIARVLEHARSMKVPFVLAHQFREQVGEELTQTFERCTAWSLDFEASTPEDIKRVEQLSLHGRYARLDWRQGTLNVRDFSADGELSPEQAVERDGLPEVHGTEVEAPIYDHNTILELSSGPRVGWFHAKMRDGYTQFVGMTPVAWDYHVPPAEHAALETAPWPEGVPGTVVVDKDPFPQAPVVTRAAARKQGGKPRPVPAAIPAAEPAATGGAPPSIEERMRRLMEDGQARAGGEAAAGARG